MNTPTITTPPPVKPAQNTRSARVYSWFCYPKPQGGTFTVDLLGETPEGHAITLRPTFSMDDIPHLRRMLDKAEAACPKIPTDAEMDQYEKDRTGIDEMDPEVKNPLGVAVVGVLAITAIGLLVYGAVKACA